jgi:hypothetical protein
MRTSNADACVSRAAIAKGRARIAPTIIRFITKYPLVNYLDLS